MNQDDITSIQKCLCVAAEADDLETVQLLLRDGNLALSWLDSLKHYSALHYAALSGSLKVLRTLLEAGANPDVRSGELMREEEDPSRWHWAPGYTPLMIACRRGSLDLAQELVATQVNVNLVDSQGGSALHAACVGSSKIVKLLLSQGADPNKESCEIYYNEEFSWHAVGRPLHVAAKCGNANAARRLLKAGANVDAPCYFLFGRSPMIYAAAHGQVEVINVLAKFGANPNLREHRYEQGAFWDYTPLHYAVIKRQYEAVKALLKLDAQRRARESLKGRTALDLAKEHGYHEIASLLK